MPGNGDVKTSRTDAVRAEIERAREQFAASAADLRQEVALRTDWREWVRAQPTLCIGAAFALGLVIGTRR